MSQTSKAKIFLADQRDCNEADWYRNLTTFNFENFFSEHKQPFGKLYTLHDQTLAAGRTIKINVEESTILYLLPVVGTMRCENNGNGWLIHPGQLFTSQVADSTSFQISNPYDNGLINFLELRVRPASCQVRNRSETFDFDLDKNKNSLVTLSGDLDTDDRHMLSPVVSIGKFGGRNEGTYTLGQAHNQLFVFVIQGVFEVQGRLLHPRDGLALWDGPASIELEALSNEAILLMIEMNGQ